MNVKNELFQCLNNIGIVMEKTDEDFDLNEYGLDSLQFISFIVEMENCFDIEFPDELLVMDTMTSFNAFTNIIEGLINDKESDNDKF